jgi:hypothetical protein
MSFLAPAMASGQSAACERGKTEENREPQLVSAMKT